MCEGRTGKRDTSGRGSLLVVVNAGVRDYGRRREGKSNMEGGNGTYRRRKESRMLRGGYRILEPGSEMPFWTRKEGYSGTMKV